MQYRNLGRAGVKVSSLCLGTMTFGEADEKSFMHLVGSDEATSHAILDRFLELGGNFIDTADVYGQDGLSERVIGRWNAARGAAGRDRLVLATKFRFRMADGVNGTGASRYRIRKACEDSLRRLQTDRIDLYQIHCQDTEVPEDEIVRALDDLVRAGKVHYVGASNYAAYRLVEALWMSDRLGAERFVSLQPTYSLLARDIEREHVPACRKHGVGILPYSPLAGGFLSGKYRRGLPLPEGTRLAKWKERYQSFDNERGWGTLDALERVAGEIGATMAGVALAWVLHKPGVTSAIFGARTLAQLEDNVRAAAIVLSPDHVRALDQASQVPMGYPYEFIGRVSGAW
ncbi:MAG: aldo/keto reductase [Deltaproteobacteria bacterium]|nr:aldo/keto reductase [Deltaproteobacteria bacterium]